MNYTAIDKIQNGQVVYTVSRAGIIPIVAVRDKAHNISAWNLPARKLKGKKISGYHTCNIYITEERANAAFLSLLTDVVLKLRWEYLVTRPGFTKAEQRRYPEFCSKYDKIIENLQRDANKCLKELDALKFDD